MVTTVNCDPARLSLTSQRSFPTARTLSERCRPAIHKQANGRFDHVVRQRLADSERVLWQNRELLVGATVLVKNSRGTQASARVVAQVGAVQGIFTYGVEFLEDETVKDFWGITFPSQA